MHLPPEVLNGVLATEPTLGPRYLFCVETFPLLCPPMTAEKFKFRPTPADDEHRSDVSDCTLQLLAEYATPTSLK